MVSLNKIKTLGDAGSYDLCAGSECKPIMHQSLKSAIYPAITNNGKCINLFKTLMTNNCKHDCKYCLNRCSKGSESYTPDELAITFFNMKKLGYVDGLFLSSGVSKEPDAVMSDMINAVTLVRKNFSGYIHLKVLPGTSKPLVKEACKLANRVSINLESRNVDELRTGKRFKDLMKRLSWIKEYHNNITTQLIVGATGESDSEILKVVKRVYDSFSLKRVYFSAFSPVKGTPLEDQKKINPLRSHRLYQTDYLMREYAFKTNEIPLHDGFLDLYNDPKLLSAIRQQLRVNINDAKREELLRVPGIGPVTVDKIIRQRNEQTIKYNELKKLGVITKKAMPFIELKGEKQLSLTNYLHAFEMKQRGL
ncbi:MAG TPA: radical SAM protein [Candidatus Nanoarchaeia archaeon]|nr:radical SAM protein [Candidatus Nanoarchaeia archaeon]